MQTLESEFPNVTFVYFTGSAEIGGDYGYNRYLRNKQIRDFCVANNKVLYDFEDLDSLVVQSDDQAVGTVDLRYNGVHVPVEHPISPATTPSIRRTRAASRRGAPHGG